MSRNHLFLFPNEILVLNCFRVFWRHEMFIKIFIYEFFDKWFRVFIWIVVLKCFFKHSNLECFLVFWIIYLKISSFFIVQTLSYILSFLLIGYIYLFYLFLKPTETHGKTKHPSTSLNIPKTTIRTFKKHVPPKHSKTHTIKTLQNTLLLISKHNLSVSSIYLKGELICVLILW